MWKRFFQKIWTYRWKWLEKWYYWWKFCWIFPRGCPEMAVFLKKGHFQQLISRRKMLTLTWDSHQWKIWTFYLSRMPSLGGGRTNAIFIRKYKKLFEINFENPAKRIKWSGLIIFYPDVNLYNTVNVLYNELYKIGSLYRMWAIFPEVSKCLTVHCCSQLRHHFSSHFGANFIFLSFFNFKLKIKTC